MMRIKSRRKVKEWNKEGRSEKGTERRKEVRGSEAKNDWRTVARDG